MAGVYPVASILTGLRPPNIFVESDAPIPDAFHLRKIDCENPSSQIAPRQGNSQPVPPTPLQHKRIPNVDLRRGPSFIRTYDSSHGDGIQRDVSRSQRLPNLRSLREGRPHTKNPDLSPVRRLEMNIHQALESGCAAIVRSDLLHANYIYVMSLYFKEEIFVIFVPELFQK